MTADAVVDRLRFTVEQFERMGEAGVLDPDTRYELLDGEVVPMSPIGARHAAAVDRVVEVLFLRLQQRATLRGQNPVRLLPRSMPQPDLAVVRRRRDFYEGGHPTAEDVQLLVEVADSSLRIDRLVKLPIYARHGIAEVWVVDLTDQVVHIHRDPDQSDYRTVLTWRGSEPFAPLAFPDVVLTPDDLLG